MTSTAKTDGARVIIAATDVALAELEAILDTSERVTLHGDDAHDWTAADVWAHLARWFGIAGEVIDRHLQRERDIHDYDEGERLNLNWIEEDRALDAPGARSRALTAWERLCTLIAGVDESRWNGFIEAHARGNGGAHVLEHLGYVVEAARVEAPAAALARLERERSSWAAFVADLDARPGVALHDPESPDWTSREIFGHFAHWTEVAIASFEAQRGGQRAPQLDELFEVTNARWAAEDRSTDLDELRTRALRAFGRRAALIVTTPGGKWTDGMRAAVAEDGYDHIAEHHRYIGI